MLLPSPIIESDPVDWDHPLNHKRKVWFLTLPWLSGGKTWWNIAGGAYNQTLTNMASLTTGGWHSTRRLGGFGEMLFDNVDDYTTSAFPDLTSNWTASAWFRITSTTSAFRPIVEWSSAAQARSGLFLGTTGLIGVNFQGNNLSATATDYRDGLWHHFVGTYDGTTTLAYIDGKSKSISTSSTAAASQSSVLRIGRFASTSTLIWAGSIDDVSIWTRVLSATEVFALYNESLLGYPETLRRHENYWLPTLTSGSIIDIFGRRGGVFGSRIIGAAA